MLHGLDLPNVVKHDSVKHVQQQWVDGHMTNYEYLCRLNTLAGRTYNDLMLYPVLPWVLANYDKHELDLINPHSYRSVSRWSARSRTGQ